MTIRIISCLPTHLAEASTVLTDAIMVEPGYRAIDPDPSTRRKALAVLTHHHLRPAIPRQTVWAAQENHGPILGVAVWAAPGIVRASFSRPRWSATEMLQLARLGPRSAVRLSRDEANSARYVPDQPVWYLDLLGVRPAAQGSGSGSHLLSACLAGRCRRAPRLAGDYHRPQRPLL